MGSYTITYKVQDTSYSGYSAIILKRIVNVVDTTAPVITITGDNLIYHELGVTYTDAGATALDFSENIQVSTICLLYTSPSPRD